MRTWVISGSRIIGEISGVTRSGFRLSPRALGQLRRLAADAAATKQGPRMTGSRRTLIYTLRVDGHTLQEVAGHVPQRLVPLVAFLNRIIDRYY